MASRISIDDCISPEEKKLRSGINLTNGLIWLVMAMATAVTMGFLLFIWGFTWLMNALLAEYNVRRLQAFGTTVSPKQFPEIWTALADVCDQLGVPPPKVIVINSGEINAFALKFARKKVVVLLSKTLEGVIDKPDELKFFLGHEVAHGILDHGGFRGTFELYKSPAYCAAREMTCDNCGCAVSGNVEAAKNALKRAGVGNELFSRLNEAESIDEASQIYSGITGWFLRRNLNYPPLGKRIQNVANFSQRGTQIL